MVPIEVVDRRVCPFRVPCVGRQPVDDADVIGPALEGRAVEISVRIDDEIVAGAAPAAGSTAAASAVQIVRRRRIRPRVVSFIFGIPLLCLQSRRANAGFAASFEPESYFSTRNTTPLP